MRKRRNSYIFASEAPRRRRSHAFRRFILTFLPILLIALVLMNFTITRSVRLSDLKVTVLNLPVDLENYSILHVSDLHGAIYGEHQRAIQTALGDTRFSCVVMTGDMLGPDHDTGPLLDFLRLLPKETAKYYIPGDQDGPFTDSGAHGDLSIYQTWARELQEAGVILLDRPVMETRGDGRIWFVPEHLYSLDVAEMAEIYSRQIADLREHSTALNADDAARLRVLEYEMERMQAVDEMRKEFLPTDIQVVLTHTPLSESYVTDLVSWSEKEETFSLRYASLILAGHYNGGQWRIPFAGALYVPELGWLPEDRLVQGLDYLEGIPQYISPGMGSDPHYTYQPGRLFNSPAMTRIILTRKVN